MTQYPRARAFPTVDLDGERVCYDPEARSLHHLNETAALVWSMCDGSTSTDGVVERVAARVELPPAHVEADVRALVAQLLAWGLCVDEASSSERVSRAADRRDRPRRGLASGCDH
jgi:hypothetical protein